MRSTTTCVQPAGSGDAHASLTCVSHACCHRVLQYASQRVDQGSVLGWKSCGIHRERSDAPVTAPWPLLTSQTVACTAASGHGQQEGPQRRRLFAPAAGSACGPTAPRCPTASAREAFPGVPVIAGGRRSVAAAARPLRLLERHRQALHPARLQGRPARLRHGREEHRRRSPAAWPPGSAREATPQHARRRLSPSGRSRRDGRDRHRRNPNSTR